MGLSVSVCLCVTFVRTGRPFVKIKNVKNNIRRFLHLQSNGFIAKIVLRELDLNCQSQTFQMHTLAIAI